jgi:hypothetical protein
LTNFFIDGFITIHFQNGIKEISPPLRGWGEGYETSNLKGEIYVLDIRPE